MSESQQQKIDVEKMGDLVKRLDELKEAMRKIAGEQAVDVVHNDFEYIKALANSLISYGYRDPSGFYIRYHRYGQVEVVSVKNIDAYVVFDADDSTTLKSIYDRFFNGSEFINHVAELIGRKLEKLLESVALSLDLFRKIEWIESRLNELSSEISSIQRQISQ